MSIPIRVEKLLPQACSVLTDGIFISTKVDAVSSLVCSIPTGGIFTSTKVDAVSSLVYAIPNSGGPILTLDWISSPCGKIKLTSVGMSWTLVKINLP